MLSFRRLTKFGRSPSRQEPFQRGFERVGELMITAVAGIINGGNAPFSAVAMPLKMSEDAPLPRTNFAAIGGKIGGAVSRLRGRSPICPAARWRHILEKQTSTMCAFQGERTYLYV